MKIQHIIFLILILAQLGFSSLSIKYYKVLNFSKVSDLFFCQTISILIIMSILFFFQTSELATVSYHTFDYYGKAFSFGTVLVGTICLCVVQPLLRLTKIDTVDFYFLYLIAIFALTVIINSTDLFLLFLSLELQAFVFYLFAGYLRLELSQSSLEGALYYFIFGSISSALFLFGFGFVYYSTGTVDFFEIFKNSSFFYNSPSMYKVGVSAIILALTFKLSLFPFNYWLLQVYYQVPLFVTTLFTLIPKIALLYTCFKWVLLILPAAHMIIIVLPFLGAITLFFMTFALLQESDLKKFLLYSSLSQFSFIFIAFINYSFKMINLTFFFLIIYILTSIVLWTFLLLLQTNKTLNYEIRKKMISNLQAFSILPSNFPIEITYIKTFLDEHQIFKGIFIFVIFSLAGIPPFVGFLAKVGIFITVISVYSGIIVVFLILLSALATYYYLKLLKILSSEGNGTKYSIFSLNGHYLHILYGINVFITILLVYLLFFPQHLYYFLEFGLLIS